MGPKNQNLSLPWLCASPYTREFRREAVNVCRRNGRRPPEVARELYVPAELLRLWLEQAEIEVTNEPWEEVPRLRGENLILREECAALRKAAGLPPVPAFFAGSANASAVSRGRARAWRGGHGHAEDETTLPLRYEQELLDVSTRQCR